MANTVDAKVVLLGKNYSGKSCLVERYLHDRYHDNPPLPATIGAAYGAKREVIDLTDSSSFDKAKFWGNELRTHEENCEIFLCGTKLDLIKQEKILREVDYNSTTDYADEIHAKVFEISSRTGENVGELFYEVAKTCLERLQVAKAPKEIPSLILLEPKKTKQKRCPCS